MMLFIAFILCLLEHPYLAAVFILFHFISDETGS